MQAYSEFAVTGTLIGYYVLCPRKAWLSIHGLWMEQESELVELGRLVDETTFLREVKYWELEARTATGIRLTGVIDRARVQEGCIFEVKKSPRGRRAHRWQLRFYLWLLQLNGIVTPTGAPYRGQLLYPKQRQREEVCLAEVHIAELETFSEAIHALAQQAEPPPVLARRSACRSCAYEELCYG